MPLHLSPGLLPDIPDLASVVHLADASDPDSEILFPYGRTPVVLAHTRERFHRTMRGDPTARFMKVTDSETGELVSVAVWHFYESAEEVSRWCGKAMEEEEGEDEKEKEDEGDMKKHNERSELFFNTLHEKRRGFLVGKPCYVLDMLFTHPAHERRGAGAMHLRWGTALADAAKRPVYLESSPRGHALYSRHGFADVDGEEVVFDFRE